MNEYHAWIAAIFTACLLIGSIAVYHIGRDPRLDAMNVCIGINSDQDTRIRCTELAWGDAAMARFTLQ